MKQKVVSLLKNPVFLPFAAALCCALWGSAFPVIKIGYGELGIESGDYGSQILFAGVRFALAGLLTVIAGSIISGKAITVKRKSTVNIVILALFQTVLQYMFFYIGLGNTTGTKSSVLDSVSVFFSVIIAGLLLKERLNIRKIIGCIVGFLGVVLINLADGGLDGGFSFTGEGFIILSALSYAISSVLIKRFSQWENPVALSGYQFILGGCVLVFSGYLMGGRIHLSSSKSIGVLLYLAFLSAAAYTLWGLLLKYNEVSRVTVYGFMIPVFGCVLSVLMLNESLSGTVLETVLSLALVCAGIVIVNTKSKLPARKADGQAERL